MADYEARIAPFINTQFYVTSIFGELPRLHKGLDIATPSPGSDLYSICNGTVVTNAFNLGGFGYYIILKDNITGMGFLYAHLREQSPLSVGSEVQIGTYVGHEGTTGSSTGIHLHLEMQDISNSDWNFNAPLSQYENPATFMGFPNTQGISVIYYGTPGPEPSFGKNKWRWNIKTNINIRY